METVGVTGINIRYNFGPFTLDLPHMILRRDGAPVKLGGRALNLLAVLVEAGGELVPRDTLLARVWPGQTIDESAIRVHLSAARKILGEGPGGGPSIVNEAGRGYRLAMEVRRNGASATPVAAMERPAVARPRLPTRLDPVLGRDEIVTSLVEELQRHRFITIAGPGGIGKTTAALALARSMSMATDIDAWFVDLAPVPDPALVPGALLGVLGQPASGGDPFARIAAQLSTRPSLILLDNCEHVVEAAAHVAEEILQRVPDILLLATSREPLRAEGEWVHRLAALRYPPADTPPDVAASAAYPAVTLFAERARAANGDFSLTAHNLPAVADICRRLDGIPLAIELAAARSDLMDPAAIAMGLDDRFGLLTRGRRTALARHRTLRATLDWSYALLKPSTQRVLDRLALFRSGFDGEAAVAIGSNDERSAREVRDSFADLVGKSLVATTPSALGIRYRLLETTRQYGLERLEEHGEGAAARRAHALYLLGLLAGTSAAWEGNVPREWLAAHDSHIDDVRGALAWANGVDGDRALAVELLIASAALWFHLSLAREFLDHAETTIAAIADSPSVESARRIELLTAYGHALWHTRGPVLEMRDAFAAALGLAEQCADEALALRALWGVWAQCILDGEYADSLAQATAFSDRVGAGGELGNRQTAAHMRALSHHFMGDHDAAMILLEEVMAGDAVPERANHANHAQVDGKIAVMSLLMRLTWARGPIAEALALARLCAADAADIDHALSSCYGLAIGCIPVAIAAGETALAGEWIDALQSQTVRHDLDHWHCFVAGYGRALGRACPAPASPSGMQREMFAVAAGESMAVAWLT